MQFKGNTMRVNGVFRWGVVSVLGGAAVACVGEPRSRDASVSGGSAITMCDDVLPAAPNGRHTQTDPAVLGELGQLKKVRNLEHFKNASGKHATYSNDGVEEIDLTNPFFQPLGTNGRACVTCHRPEDGFGLTAQSVQEAFDRTCGTDPLFRTVDGSNSPTADVSTVEARRAAYSLLLDRGVIRVQIPIPATAEFELIAHNDPYGNDISKGLSVFRRPLPSTNLKTINMVMFDGREPNLASQANNATRGHAELDGNLATDVAAAIVAFETKLFTSQVVQTHNGVGSTTDDVNGVFGDPVTLSTKARVGGAFVGTPSTRQGFTMFNGWANLEPVDETAVAKASVARGQVLFNNKRFVNPNNGAFTTCSNHHAVQDVGSGIAVFTGATTLGNAANDIHTSDPAFMPNLPTYTLKKKGTDPPVTITTTDPGMALTTGKWAHVNFFKNQGIRGLAAHGPYFHNGGARTLRDVVDFYNSVFTMAMTEQEKQDLTSFLTTL